MKNLSILLILSLLFQACQNGKTGNTSGKTVAFRTTAPSHLYFKNIRSIHYEMTTRPGTRIDLYKFKRFSDTRSRPILFPIIVDNWMQDEAYLLIRPNDYRSGFPDTLQVNWRHEQDSGRYVLRSADWTDQYRFAQQLGRSLEEEHHLEVLNREEQFVPLFENRQDRNYFLTTLRDYYRLTER